MNIMGRLPRDQIGEHLTILKWGHKILILTYLLKYPIVQRNDDYFVTDISSEDCHET